MRTSSRRLCSLPFALSRNLCTCPFAIDPLLPSHGRLAVLAQEIQTLCDSGHLHTALDALRLRLDADRLLPIVPFGTYLSLLKACSKAKELAPTRHLHALLCCQFHEPPGILADQLIAAFASCGALNEALCVLLSLSHRSIFSWRALISGYSAWGQGREALEAYQSMQEEGIEPDQYTFVSLIKACAIAADLTQAQKLHADAMRRDFTSDVFVGSILVTMYGKCGSILEAENVFDHMCEKNVVAWSAMLSAYVEHGEGAKALLLYMQMHHEGVSLDQQTFVIVLQACSALVEKSQSIVEGIQSPEVVALEIVQSLHAEVRRKRFLTNVFIGSSLISMYGKYGSIIEAENVFDAFLKHDVVLWSAMLSAYVDQGLAIKALHLYRQMQGEGVYSDKQTFLITLSACGSLVGTQEAMANQVHSTQSMPLDMGWALHADAQGIGFVSDILVGNAVISMYGKCGSIMAAENVFSELSYRDIVSWNAMLSAYVEQVQAEKVLRLYRQMQEEDVHPDWQTFVIVLQACGILSGNYQFVIQEGHRVQVTSLEVGRGLHVDAWKMGFSSDTFVGNTIVSMYGKCRSIVEAEHVFNRLSKCDTVTWNVMISGYAEEGQGEKALQLYGHMQVEGVNPVEQTIVIALQACDAVLEKEETLLQKGGLAQVTSLDILRALHADAWRKGYVLSAFVNCSLVCMYGKCGSILEAETMFNVLPKDTAMWNAMLSAFVEQAQKEKALHLYRQMQEEGAKPDERTIVIALQACAIQEEKGRITQTKSLEIGQALHVDALQKGFTSDIYVCSTLVSMYSKCGSIVEAENVFDGLSDHTVVLWNALLSAYLEVSQVDKALQVYFKMKAEDVILNDITILSAVAACRTTGSVEMCRQLHFDIVFAGYDLLPEFGTALICTYGDCSCMVDAQAVFNGMRKKDVAAWTACINGYVQEGNSLASLQMFDEMQPAGIIPNGFTFLSLLSACSHSGFVDKGIELYASMSRDYGIVPMVQHFVTMIDLVARVGEFQRVEQILLHTPMHADWAFWMCLLNACHTYGHVKLGKQVFDHAVSLKPEMVAAYVVMSNIYADAGLYECAAEVEKSRWTGSLMTVKAG